MAELVITIDGPAASGKSTMARSLAERLAATFLDTGAMYRAITLAAVRDGVELSDEGQLVRVVDQHRFDFEAAPGKMLVRIDGQDATEAIRDTDLTARVRHAASSPRVRERLVEMQRAFAAEHPKIVTEGRDQGTVVFPEARVKIYLTADAAERARRRVEELTARGQDADPEQMRQAIDARDRSDESRAVGPLKPASDAMLIDTTGLSIEEAVELIHRHVKQRLSDHKWRPPVRAEEKVAGPGSDLRNGRPKTTGVAGVAQQARDPGRTAHKNATSVAAPQALHTLMAAWYWLARFVCRMFCTLVFRYRMCGRENIPQTGSVIFACNHQSYLDPVFCGVAVKRHLTYVARDTLFHHRFFGPLITSVNAIPIGRDKADIAAMRMIIDRLREGAGVCLYPEGTRTHDGRIIPVKPGFGLLCRRSKAAVVPVLIDGAFEVWPRHQKFFSPGAITVCFGRPLQPEQIRTMTNQQLADHLTRTLRQMQHEARIEQGKKPYNYEE